MNYVFSLPELSTYILHYSDVFDFISQLHVHLVTFVYKKAGNISSNNFMLKMSLTVIIVESALFVAAFCFSYFCFGRFVGSYYVQ